MNSVRKGFNKGRGAFFIITILIISLSLPSYISSYHDSPIYEFHEQSDILGTVLEQDHEWLAVLLKNGSIYFRHLSNLSRFHTILISELDFLDDVHLGKNKFMDWNNEGDYFASVIGKKKVRIWNTTTWAPQQEICLKNSSTINNINWSPRENILVIGTGNMIIIWDVDRSENICNVSNIYSDALYWNPQQPYLGAIRWDHLWIINTDNWEVVKEIEDDFATFSMNIEWSPDGSRFATAHPGTIKIWESNSWKILTKFEHHLHFILDISWSDDGKRLAAGSNGRLSLNPEDMDPIRFWDTTTWKEETVINGDFWADVISWFHNDSRLCVVSYDNRIRVFDAERNYGRNLTILEVLIIDTVMITLIISVILEIMKKKGSARKTKNSRNNRNSPDLRRPKK